MIKTTVNLTGLALHFQGIKHNFRHELERVLVDLEQEAERNAKQLLTILVYATPESPTYERTRALINSITAHSRRASHDLWEVVVYASGSGERHYASYVEGGTFGGHRTFDEILRDAQGFQADLIVLEYGQPSKGVQPKPFIVPAAVMTARAAPPLIIQAVRRAAKR
jgi:hypothetical protein